MQWIAGTTLGANAASINFGSGGLGAIPQTFTDLQLRVFSRGTIAFSPGLSLYLQFNTDSGSNYIIHQLYGDGTSAASQASTPRTNIGPQQVFPDSGATTNVFGLVIADILNYTNINKYKTVKTLGGYDNNGSGRVSFNSGAWMNTAAITSILVSTDGNLLAGTRADLYGITTSQLTGA